MMHKLRQSILNGHLGVTNFHNVSFEAANSPVGCSAIVPEYIKTE
jgi:hypothetical protein